MTHQHRILAGLVLIGVGMSAIGCGNNTHLSGLVPAGGIVKYNGEPAEGVSVLFIPDGTETSGQRTASALSDSKGEFRMMTLHPQDGAFPGKYKVVITKEVPDREFTPQELEEMETRTKGIAPPTFKNLLPAIYAKPETTPLDITLERRGDKNIVFELTN